MTDAGAGTILTRILMAVVPISLGIVCIGLFIVRRSRASGWLLFYAAVGVGLGFLGARGLLRQVQGHQCITTLDPNQVLSISVSGKNFDDRSSVLSLVVALRSSSWFLPSHTQILEKGDIEIRRRNGKLARYHIGTIHNGRDFLIYDEGFAFQDVNKELVTALEKLRH